jgi:cell division septum initiation protein DivIVA
MQQVEELKAENAQLRQKVAEFEKQLASLNKKY